MNNERLVLRLSDHSTNTYKSNKKDKETSIVIELSKHSFINDKEKNVKEYVYLPKNLTPEVRNEICKNNYGKINDEYIGNWLQGCTILRNICAHRGRQFNRQIPFSLRLGKNDKLIFKNNGISINKATKQLFAYLIVMKKMIPDDNVWNTFTSRLVDLKNKYPFVRLDYYGFTEDWEKLLGIKSEKSA